MQKRINARLTGQWNLYNLISFDFGGWHKGKSQKLAVKKGVAEGDFQWKMLRVILGLSRSKREVLVRLKKTYSEL